MDPDRVRRLLQTLAEFREGLGRLATLPAEEYAGDEAYAGRYLVQASAQTCLDVAGHIIASEGWRAPRDFRDAFTVLEEHGVVSSELAERLRALAGLRNRLVHVYDDVDDALIHEALPEGLDDLNRFAQDVARFLDESAAKD